MSNNKDKSSTSISNNALEAIDVILKNDFVHIREISRKVGISPTTTSILLKSLEEKGILTKKTLGKNCFYSLSKDHRTATYIAMLENYRFLKACDEKSFNDIAENLLNDISEIKGFVDCVIASRTSQKLQLIFITSLDNDTIRSKIKQTKGISRINVFTRENFRNNKDSQMIKDPLKDYIVVYGAEKMIY